MLFTSCGLPGADARKFPPEPQKRVDQNLAEGKGFRLMGKLKTGTNYEFASSNPLWKATLDTLDFMPLVSANYSGGIIITDWYSDEQNSNESIKISIRFLTNEIRSDALDIKIFSRKCSGNFLNCKITETDKVLVSEITKEILKKAAVYEKEKVTKRKKARKK